MRRECGRQCAGMRGGRAIRRRIEALGPDQVERLVPVVGGDHLVAVLFQERRARAVEVARVVRACKEATWE